MTTAVVERYGALSATGIGKEPAFGTVTVPTVSTPMSGNGLELDPGLFSPKVMFGQRDLNTFPLRGQYKSSGTLTMPQFPTMGVVLLAGAIGQDATVGNGVTGTGSTSPTTLSGAVAAGANTITVTDATGYVMGSIVQVDVNATGPATTAECRKVTNVAATTLTLDQALTYGHLANAPVTIVTAPFTHTIRQANLLPSFTVEKNLGGAESLQFSGARINKYGLSIQAGNQEAQVSVDWMAKHAAVLDTPSAITVVDEMPYVFAEAQATIFGQTVSQVTGVDLSIENGVKDTYTLNQSHDPQFLTPVTLHVMAKVDLVFTSLDDTDWGYWTKMVNGTEGALGLTLAHPANGGSVALNMNRGVIGTYGDGVKIDDVILTTLNIEAYLDLTTLHTISATVVNSNYLPY